MGKRPTIYAVDFDGTLAELVPHEEEPVRVNTKLIEYLKAKQDKGCIIILWTCRTDEKLRYAINLCGDNGLIFDYVNSNAVCIIEQYGDSRKIFADVYIDDKFCFKEEWNIPFVKEK